ncbi:Uncharacterized damage-inducible protein DinB (forms a four-helix bundle) [Chitinophaga sp. CF118]|uniref:DinB family protein n=1 Tax=Chitinophaga sp. CF118 TaxID=1884367 RepID=UPI0008E5F716|nr:DinB family protein [Chitinophaga sp. CF118]SFF01813.1 Uncharacterized damage-inducible protein DinB (forms a four-helix bundle) [Chitinophaga sp. CF118]
MKEIWISQYDLIKSSRSVLLDYCETLTPEHFIAETPGFGHDGSIRNLLVHIANTYEYWIGHHCFGRTVTYPPNGNFTTVNDCRIYFDAINLLIEEFINHFGDAYAIAITSFRREQSTTATPLAAFTHVTTHEFHHKGQILSMSRHMGYIPVDTDIIR